MNLKNLRFEPLHFLFCAFLALMTRVNIVKMIFRSEKVADKTVHFFWIALLLFSLSCQDKKRAFERPMDPWAFRSVLDRKPRMLTLALSPDCYVAYDLQKSQLYKVWKGGVVLEGTVYTNKKNIQPISWGADYIEKDKLANQWKLYHQGVEISDLKLDQKGYTFRNGQIRLHYEIHLDEHRRIKIDETPEFSLDKQGKPVFERLFEVTGILDGDEIRLLSNSGDFFSLSSNGEHAFISHLEPLPDPDMPSLTEQYDHLGILRMEGSDCYTCHEEVNKMVGPSFTEIAARYHGDRSSYPDLIRKIREGGGGAWGNSVMNPHPQLAEEDIKPMLDYIMTFAPKVQASVSGSVPIRQVGLLEEKKKTPGFGAPLEAVHPSYDKVTLHHRGFEPRVGALAFLPDGGLLVSTWDAAGGIYLLKNVEQSDTARIEIKRIASGLAEPLGLEVVDGDIYVLQKHELTRLRDLDGDGVMDEYFPICNSWGVTDDFHEFAFGLLRKDDHFYITLSMPMRLATHEKPHPDRGRTLKISEDGTYQWLDYGLRTPNGIGEGIDGEIFVTDNQGQWLPGNKLIHVQEGAYNGMGWALPDTLAEIPRMVPPAIWLPDGEIGNSPSEPILMKDGPYKGQLLHGDVTHGGIKRDFLEKINGAYQGVVFRFTQGLHAGVNRLVWGPDGSLYVGEIGMVGGWSWKERQFGLEKLTYNGRSTFEMLAIRAKPKGFEIEFTEPLADSEFGKDHITIQQWWYLPTPSYGGPKKDLRTLVPSRFEVSQDRKKVYIEIPGLKEEHVVYFLLADSLRSDKGQSLWSGEAWYTLNNIPNE